MRDILNLLGNWEKVVSDDVGIAIFQKYKGQENTQNQA
jgi:hypothetical protein